MTAVIVVSIVVVLIFIVFYGFWHFTNLVEKEKDILFNTEGKTEQKIVAKDLEPLPELMQEYLERVGVLGKCKDCHATLKQSGRIKTAPGKKWMNFTATQYMTAKHPGFIWSARSYPLFIRDKSIYGEGEVKVSLLGIKDVALSYGPKTNISALGRSLGELLFYPVGFLSDDIRWEVIDKNSVKAVATLNEITTEGVFYFNEQGLLQRFESKRYKDETLENFTGTATDYKMMQGLYIPTKMKAIWNLKKGDFEYFDSTITDFRIQ